MRNIFFFTKRWSVFLCLVLTCIAMNAQNAPAIGGIDSPNGDDTVSYIVYVIAQLIAYALLIAVFVLQIRQNSRKSQSVINTEDLRQALKKPLEGEWNYSVHWGKFFDDYQATSTGKALFIWNSSQQRYDIYIFYSIKVDGQAEDCVTALLHGTLRDDEREIQQLTYKVRKAISEFETTIKPIASMTDVKYIKNKGIINQIEAKSNLVKSTGKVTFTR